MSLLSTTALAVLGGCLTDGDVGRGTTDETNTARIVGPGGSSAPGAEILVFKLGDTTQTPLYVTYADKDGRYSLKDLPNGRYNLVANSGTLALYRDSVALGPMANRVDTLSHPGSLRGTVELEPGDNPRTVVVQAVGTDLFSNVDSAGRFSFPKISAGDYTLRAVTVLRDYTPTFARVEAVDDSAVVLKDPIRLVYVGKEPRVFGPDGYPAAGAVVSLFRTGTTEESPVLRMLTDASGRYSLSGLEAGRYNLLVKSGDLGLFRDSVRLAPGVVRTDTLRRVGSLRGRVELQYGDDPSGVRVRLDGTDIGCLADSTGGFLFLALPGGEYAMTVSAYANYGPQTRQVMVFDDSAVVLQDPIRLEYTGAPPVLGFQAVYDTLAGLVRLSWHRDPRVAGYRIRREGTMAPSAEDWTTSDTCAVDTVFHVGRGFGVDEPTELRLRGDGSYRVCGLMDDGTEGRCASVALTVVTPYAKARQSGIRWSRIGRFAAKSETGNSHLRIQSSGDSVWIFHEAGWSGWVEAWKSADGANWAQVSDSLPIDVDWRMGANDYYSVWVYPTPQLWNDTLWAFRSSGDTLQLVASRDGKTWQDVALPRTYVLRQDQELLFKPSLLATSAGLEIFMMQVSASARVPPGCRRNERGEWEEGTAGLSVNPATGNQPMVAFTHASSESGLWSLSATAGLYYFMVNPTAWIENASEPSGTARRPIPLSGNIYNLAEIDGLLYLPGSDVTYSSSTGGVNTPTLLATRSNDSSSPWWSIDLPEGCTSVSALSVWKGKVLMVAVDGSVWLGEPTAAP